MLGCVQNPLSFLLRAAQIYPDRLALAHSDAKHPVFYTYGVWYAIFATEYARSVV